MHIVVSSLAKMFVGDLVETGKFEFISFYFSQNLNFPDVF
jgi:hypothetical protein